MFVNSDSPGSGGHAYNVTKFCGTCVGLFVFVGTPQCIHTRKAETPLCLHQRGVVRTPGSRGSRLTNF
jgi:hypothetical protein